MRYCLIIFVILISSCSGDNVNESFSKKGGNIQKEKELITIDIQPFSDVTKEQVNFVHRELLKIYPNIEIKKAIELPQLAYYELRNRYRADSLISFLNRRAEEGHVIIGLTNKDISTTKGEIKDYGIFGLGWCPGNACVASSFRLSKTEPLIQLFKIAIHELGHTQGLPHCPVKTCFMRDAEGKNHMGEEKEFCPKCKAHLINKGWALE